MGVAWAAATRTWEQTRYDEFEKGVATGVALRSDGKLALAPRFTEIFDAPTAHLWTLARDSKGNLYAAGGPGARVFQITPDGKKDKFFETDALDIHALAVDGRDHVYAATSPDSKIYRIDPQGRPALFCDAKVKYVWAMAFNSRGELLLATGDKGEILRLDSSGRSSVFFKTDESHIRSLVINNNDEVLIGTDPGGLVMRVAATGASGFVLHQTTKKEVTALALGPDGALYAAAVGTRTRAAPLPSLPPLAPATPAPVPSAIGAPLAAAPQLPPPAGIRVSITGGSEVVRISADGSPRRLWSSNDDIVYALGLNPAGRLVIGTGNGGRIFQIESDTVHSLLLKAAPSQVTALLGGAGGKLFAATGNIGKIYQLGPELEARGAYESDIFDAGVFSRWGRLSWKGTVPGGGSLSVQTRSGNLNAPSQYWSAWSKPVASPEGAPVDSPAARFVQWRAVLETRGSQSPLLDSVTLAYQPKNIAPTITEMEMTPPNYRFPDPPSPSLAPPSLSLPAVGARPSRSAPAFQSTRPLNFARGYLGVRWLASDENDDQMTCKVEIRGVSEQNWKLLAEEIDEPQLTWDSTAFADGLYQLRVTVSDSPSNPGNEAWSYSKESEPFHIDNTPPAISPVAAAAESRRLRVRFRAADALTNIKKSEYSVDGSDWRPMLPVTRLFDGRELDYDFLTEEVAGGEHTVAVRVWDANDNLAAAKSVVR